ncbi:demethoxyubiquinone hydroxylase family protein [Pseudoduganella sp. S-14]|uniref:demethoxyubiquinone hydroxylase family protein n=1 Tax=Pseudoduganella sp. S-14 TaxID=3404065 RepID=UPI003CFA0B99
MRSEFKNDALNEFASRVLRVNHAGGNGAVHIYSGQIFMARFTAPSMVAELIEFKSHEERHRAIFWNEMTVRKQRRCKSYWLCGAGGFVLGVVSGAFGRRAIAATTVAVERVVLRHMEEQLVLLAGKDEAAFHAVASIVIEERQHHDRSVCHIAQAGFWSRILSPVVAAATEAVIWIGMRV